MATKRKHPVHSWFLGQGSSEPWPDLVANHIPGIKVSDLPMHLFVEHLSSGGAPSFQIFNMATDVKAPDRMANVRKELEKMIQRDWDPSFRLPRSWTLEQWIKNAGADKPWNPLDVDNPRVYDVEGNERRDMQHTAFLAEAVKSAFLRQLGLCWHSLPGDSSSTPINKRSERVREYLDHHHVNGGNPKAFRDYVGSIARNTSMIPPPMTLGTLALRASSDNPAEFKFPALADPEGLSLLILEWLAGSEKEDSQMAEPARTFAELLGVSNTEALRAAMKDAGIVYKTAKGKGRVIAALHAACDHFGKPTPRPMDWPSMLKEFLPNSKWSHKCVPVEKPSLQGKEYREAYLAIKDRLSP